MLESYFSSSARPDFFESDYCFDTEMQEAMRRHTAGQAPHYPSDPSSLPLADGSLRPVSGGTERWKTTEDLVESGRRLLRCSYPHHGSCQGTPRSGGTRD